HWQAIALRERAGDALAQRPRAPRDGVLVDVGVNGGAGGVLDPIRRRKIRKALRQIHAAVQLVQARHLADHRLGELRRLLGSGEFGHTGGNSTRPCASCGWWSSFSSAASSRRWTTSFWPS